MASCHIEEKIGSKHRSVALSNGGANSKNGGGPESGCRPFWDHHFGYQNAWNGGIEVLKEIQRRSYRVGVIAISGVADIEMAREAMRHAALDYLVKPFNLELLASTISFAIKKQRIIERQSVVNQSDRGKTASAVRNSPLPGACCTSQKGCGGIS